MDGGLTLYCDGIVFSILDQDATLYLKARAEFADEMTAAGSLQFGTESGKTMCYRTLPDAAIDDTDAALDWEKRALCAL
ncbi:MAG: TfoX-like protein [Marinosulfonomonas sp.]|nr:MAG: TfoX-like protein [Marinosulfonomonas sp.]